QHSQNRRRVVPLIQRNQFHINFVSQASHHIGRIKVETLLFVGARLGLQPAELSIVNKIQCRPSNKKRNCLVLN
ncbi:hypothetical protein HAX54_010625, partial [Datura stramonium]|nr:hypothetical protein [Datura stramonium]